MARRLRTPLVGVGPPPTSRSATCRLVRTIRRKAAVQRSWTRSRTAGKASLLRVDEKSQVQAPGRITPVLPMRPATARTDDPPRRPAPHEQPVRSAVPGVQIGHRADPPAPPPPGAIAPRQAHRLLAAQRLRAALGPARLRKTRHTRLACPPLAAPPPAVPPALHPDLAVPDEPGRALVRRADQAPTARRGPPLRRRAQSRPALLGKRLEQKPHNRPSQPQPQTNLQDPSAHCQQTDDSEHYRSNKQGPQPRLGWTASNRPSLSTPKAPPKTPSWTTRTTWQPSRGFRYSGQGIPCVPGYSVSATNML